MWYDGGIPVILSWVTFKVIHLLHAFGNCAAVDKILANIVRYVVPLR